MNTFITRQVNGLLRIINLDNITHVDISQGDSRCTVYLTTGEKGLNIANTEDVHRLIAILEAEQASQGSV